MTVPLKSALALLLPLGLGTTTCTPVQAQGPTAAQLAAMKADYRRPAAKPIDNPALVDLGRLLFWDPRVSASGKTACVTCHLPYLGWGAADARSRSCTPAYASPRTRRGR